jgi:hypothetical protein
MLRWQRRSPGRERVLSAILSSTADLLQLYLANQRERSGTILSSGSETLLSYP